ncbi:hypothetical protein TRVA0_002S02916 [Trichomonascus vanleenenianus]|uniref:uncharacterized protein n=1 Tax=Trichomonascus vanleenenianus TaxID=2268995 RepID=UPI003ECA4B63
MIGAIVRRPAVPIINHFQKALIKRCFHIGNEHGDSQGNSSNNSSEIDSSKDNSRFNRKNNSSKTDSLKGNSRFNGKNNSQFNYRKSQFKGHLKHDPRVITEFSQLIPKALVKTIASLVKTPTAIQKAVLSLKSSQSVIAQSYPGTGKSLLAALKAAMRSHAAPETPFTSLILVPTPDLAHQYTKWLNQIVPSINVQQVFRSLQEQEHRQEENMVKTPPNILVATPQRVLDMIHQDSGALPLENIEFVAIDEAERLLSLSKRGTDKKRRLKNPTELLLSHIQQVRTKKVASGLCILVIDSDISPSLVSQIKTSEWAGSQKFLEVGQPTTAGGALHSNKLPRDVEFYAVNYDFKKKALVNFDFQRLEYRDLFRKDVTQFMKRTKPYVPTQEQLAMYCEAFKHVFETNGHRKGLLLVPTGVSSKVVVEQLRKLGIIAGLGDGIYLDGRNRAASFEPGTMFLNSEHYQKKEEVSVPDVIVYDRYSVSGLDFPGLSDVYAMSWSVFNNSEHELVRVASRIRQVDATQRGERGKLGPSGATPGKVVVVECVSHPDKLENINAQITIVLGKVDGELTRLPITAKSV